MGPLLEWFVTVSSARCLRTAAVSWLSPGLRFSTSPTRRPSARGAKALEIILPLSCTRTDFGLMPSGVVISTSACPPDTRSARFDSTSIPTGSLVAAREAASSTLPGASAPALENGTTPVSSATSPAIVSRRVVALMRTPSSAALSIIIWDCARHA
jgi:hypothetical protein